MFIYAGGRRGGRRDMDHHHCRRRGRLFLFIHARHWQSIIRRNQPTNGAIVRTGRIALVVVVVAVSTCLVMYERVLLEGGKVAQL